MRTIQEVGLEILNHQPKNFYVFAGTEYGIKLKYLSNIAQTYDNRMLIANSVESVLGTMRVKHFIPLEPSLYVVRYDDEFLSSLNNKTKDEISSINIIGTIVCIYDSQKASSKLDKYLSDYTVSIDSVDSRFVRQYLHQDFKLPDRLIDSAIKASADYNQAQNICRCMSYASVETFFAMSDDEISRLFGYKAISSEEDIKLAVADRNFRKFMYLIDTYPDQLDNTLYAILSLMLEFEKILTSKFYDSKFRKFSEKWTIEQVYNMFMSTYRELKILRSNSSYKIQDSLVMLGSLLLFKNIPNLEEMNEF